MISKQQGTVALTENLAHGPHHNPQEPVD